MRKESLIVTTLTLLFIVTIFAPPTATITNANVRTFSNFPATKYSGSMEVTAYTSPDSSFSVTIAALQDADEEIDVCIYAISNGFILKELNNAMQRNPSMVINVIVSYRHASGFESSYTRGALYNLSKAADNAGATNVNLYLSSNTYDFTHAKYIIVDREVVLVQSANWAKTSIPKDPSYGNREWGVMIKNNDIVNYFLQVFNNDMTIATPYVPEDDDESSFSANVSKGSYSHPFTSKKFTGSMEIQPIVSPDNDVSAIKQILQSATNAIYVQQAYIKTKWDSGSNEFLDELIDAVDRGVTVKVIIDKTPSGAEDSANLMASKGIEIAFSNSVFEYCHNKGIIVDGEIVLISSINWSNEAANENREAGVIIYNSDIASYFAQVFTWDWQNAEIVSGETTIEEETGGEGEGLCLGTILLGLLPIVALITITISMHKKKHH